jgi:hypothetical protein
MIVISGGNFQNAEGAPLANGTLVLKLSWDSTESVTTPNGTIYAGPRIAIPLDSSGNCPSTAIWSNAELNLSTYYLVNLYDSNGVPVLEAQLTWIFTQTETQATGTLAFTCAGTANDTVTIGTQVYTFVSSLTAPYQVLIGVSAAATAANFVAAVNGAAGEGTTYSTGTAANTQVTASLSGTTVTVTAIDPGIGGNSISIAASSTCFAWSPVAATGSLVGTCAGTNGDTITIGTNTYTLVNNLTLTANEVLIGVSASATASNLVAAINGAAGAGVIYSIGTVASTQVTAALNGSIVALTAITAGTGGNSIGTTASSTCFAFTSTTLTGGGTPSTLTGGGNQTPVDLGTVVNATPNGGAVNVPVPGPQGPQGIQGPAGTAVGSAFGAIEYIIDGGASTPGTGLYGTVSIPTDCHVTGWNLIADASGDAVIDVLLSTFAAFPTNASICGTDKPTLASSQKQQNLTLTEWSTALGQGDIVQFNLVSVTTCKRLCLTLYIAIP